MLRRPIFVSDKKSETHVTIVIESKLNEDCEITAELKKALKEIKHLGLNFSFAVINVRFPNQE